MKVFCFLVIGLNLIGQEALPPATLAKLVKPATAQAGFKIRCQDPILAQAFKAEGITIDPSSPVAWVKDAKELSSFSSVKVLTVCTDKSLCASGACLAIYKQNGKLRTTINQKAVASSFSVLPDFYYKAAQ